MDERIEALEGVISALIDILAPLQPPSTQKDMIDMWNMYADIARVLEQDK